ncbi:MAG TPA: hypothetical protein VHN20_00345, partial [Beijerinckiaceae bacterium]|nr:hypothetical protein [Beijerinckiaceae bacterium]
MPAALLTSLEEVRRQTLRRMDLRALWMIPLCAALGFGLSKLFIRDGSLLIDGFVTLAGAFTGWGLAADPPLQAFRTAYKERVLPHLVAQFGALRYRRAVQPHLERLVGLDLLPAYSHAVVEDEIFGSHRDVPLSIVEADLTAGHGKSRHTV